MRKSLFALLLALCMVVCFAAITVSAEETTAAHTDHCICGGVELTESGAEIHKCSETIPTWQPLSAATLEDYFTVTSNRYVQKSEELYLYLTEDVELAYSINLNGGNTIHLCLNGNELSIQAAQKQPVMRVWGDLDVTDCSENETGAIVGTRTGESPCLYVQNWRSGTEYYTPTLNLYAGTLTAIDGDASAKAGVMQVGNTANGTKDNYATFNMYGGKICGGAATDGGNVYFETAAAVFNMYGGTITGGKASGSGGGICCMTAGATIKLLGGEITGNESELGAAVYTTSSVKVTLGGDIQIDEYYSNSIVLTLENLSPDAKIGLGRNNSNDPDKFATGATENVADCFTSFTHTRVVEYEDGNLSFVKHKDHCVCADAAGMPENHECEKIQDFQELTKAHFDKAGTDTSPVYKYDVTASDGKVTTYYDIVSGNYYLSANVTLTGTQIRLQGDKVVTICLNGYTLSSNTRLFDVYGKLNITDCSGTENSDGTHTYKGTMKSTGFNYGGSVMYTRSGSSVNIYGGNFEGRQLPANAPASFGGGVFYVGAEMNIYDGKIFGGNFSLVTGNSGSLHGGNIQVADGTVNMYAGTITGGKSGSTSNGGNLYVSGGAFNMYGGTISGGNAKNGGNVALNNASAVFTMNGGIITGGNATTNGGNIFADNGSIFTMEDGTISKGNAGNGGGNVRTNGVFNMSNGTITGGTATQGGNVVVGSGANYAFNMYGGTVTGGKALTGDAHGGNFAVFGTLEISNGKVENGEAKNYGGNISGFRNHSKIRISGGEIIDGKASGTNGGGNIAVDFQSATSGGSCELTITGGTITGGNATNGGNIALININANIATVTISGGTISGGKATNGGNVYVNGQVTMSGDALITGGNATGAGGNIYVNKGTFTMEGGTVSYGTANGTGGNVRVQGSATDDAVFNLKNGTISDSAASQAGNVCIAGQKKAVFNMVGGTVTKGKATGNDGHGGNILAFGELNISGGTVSDGEAVMQGGNISAYNNYAKVRISGGTITGGEVTSTASNACGGNIYICFTGSNESNTAVLSFEITGNTVIENGTAKNGGNIALAGRLENASVVISGGTISGGNATDKGDGIYVSSGDLTIKDAALLNNDGVDLYVNNADETTAVTIQNITDEFVVDAADKAVAFASSTEDCSDKLVSADEIYIVFWTEGKLFLKKLNTAAVYAGKELVQEYKTFEEAAAAAMSGAGYVKLLDNTVSDFEVTGVLYLDLNGYDLSGIIVSGTLYGMDSTTDAYDDANAGVLTYTLSGEGVVPVHHKAEANVTGAVRRYLTYTEGENAVSFHRIYLGITRISLRPGVVGVGYKAQFGADEKAQFMLDMSEAFGYSLWLEQKDGTQIGRTATVYKGADAFSSGDFVTLRLQNFPVAEHGETLVCANVYLKLNDEAGTVIDSTEYQCTLRQMLELADGYFNDYTEVQQKALVKMCADHADAMISWDLPNIHKAEGSGWQSVTKDELIALFADNKVSINGNDNRTVLPAGRYELSEDVNIGVRTIVINEGETVSICLNGHKLTGSATMFRNFGTLNICDCHGSDAEGHVVSTVKSATANGGVLYSYYESVTNLYGGSLEAEGNVSSAGVVAISHDAKADEDKAKPAAVFNMYGGSISGGNAANGGGNISLWNKSTFNLYNGTVSGGTAGTTGGNIHCASGCTVNIYGGTIEGGTSATYGGNIYTSGKLNMYGGTVTGGTATGFGGGISVESTASAYISGDVIIDNNNDSNLYKRGYWNVTIEDLGANAKIGVSGDTHGVIYNDAAAVTQFASDDAAYKVCAMNGKVLLMGADYETQEIESNISTFSVGYDITNINPTDELLAKGLAMSSWGNANGRTSYESSSRELHATTVAITDANNNTVLMVTLDLQGHLTYHDRFRSMISEATGVPVDNIYLSATHTHNCPDITSSNENNVQYVYYLTDLLIESALGAMADRAPATMQTGSFDTDGMNFGRHYKYTKVTSIFPYTTETIYVGDNFGSYTDSWLTSDLTRVREGDETMHLLAFQRGDEKQPVLVANWRAHPHRSGGADETKLDADVIGATRNYITANSDYLFAYFQGAAGNMNTTSRISGETKYSSSDYDKNIDDYGDAMGYQILNVGVPGLTSAATGLIQTEKISYSAKVDHREDAKAATVDEFVKLYNAADLAGDEAEMQRLLEEYEFSSKFHAQRVKTKANMADTQNLELNVFSIGKSVGFYTAPAELWDSFSEEIEGLDSFATTFCIGYSNGYVAYIPYNLVEADNEYNYKVAYDSYEGDYCLFIEEKIAPEMLDIYLAALQRQFATATNDSEQ